MKEFFLYVLHRTKNACWTLFKFMIPISILIRFIQEWGLLTYMGDYLSPVMNIVGLPIEMGLVWLTSMVVGIWGGLITMFSLYPYMSDPLTVAQMTTLLTMILIAHTFPIELTITKKTGVRVWYTFLLRFGGAILLGFIMSKIYQAGNWLQDPAHVTSVFTTTETTWKAWALNEVKNYLIITCVIFILITFIRILQITGIIKIINKLIAPALGWLGISDSMLPLTIIGLTLGIAYGGGLLIEEGKQHSLKPRDIFYSITLMSLFHSIIEDTLLMLSMGGHWSGVIVFRTIFAFALTYLIVFFTRKISEKNIVKYFMAKRFRIKTLNDLTT